MNVIPVVHTHLALGAVWGAEGDGHQELGELLKLLHCGFLVEVEGNLNACLLVHLQPKWQRTLIHLAGSSVLTCNDLSHKCVANYCYLI